MSAADNDRIRLMMHYSHNSPPTSQLYVAGGGAAGMERLDGRFGIAGTSHTAHYGATVSVAQSWGLSAGLPAGHDVALTNGFYPMSGRGWRVGTTGVVRTPAGDAYAVSVLTESNATESDGIALVEAVTRRVNAALTLGAPERRAVDGVVGVTSGATWASVASTLGVGDLAVLRHINGGESAPLSGQRACAP